MITEGASCLSLPYQLIRVTRVEDRVRVEFCNPHGGVLYIATSDPLVDGDAYTLIVAGTIPIYLNNPTPPGGGGFPQPGAAGLS